MSASAEPRPTVRAELLARLAESCAYDVAVVGGGATGLGVALDAAARGLRVVLLEAHDFAKGTSSRSTKLVHGGVRYLAQGRIHLVREALRERALLLANAPHLAQPLPFVIPAYRWWERPWYGAGLTLYDALAGDAGLGATQWLSPAQALQALPTAQPAHLQGGVQYWDGQFDDARLALALARTAAAQGALLLNYCRVDELVIEQGRVTGLRCVDAESGRRFAVQARCVINATGVWVDALRQPNVAVPPQAVGPLVSPSQGVHLVVDREFLPGSAGLMVPKTADGRVLFALPWLGKVILGTTDTPRPAPELEPQPLAQEVAFILAEAGRYLSRAPQRQDVRSAWAGMRPLVRPTAGDGQASSGLSREHAVEIDRRGLVSVTGGKWTTYRAMAEDVLAQCAARGLLAQRPAGVTATLRLVGGEDGAADIPLCQSAGLHSYGSEQAHVLALPGARRYLAPGLSEAMVRFAARHEYARTVEDMLARRWRLLFLDARLAAELAPAVGDILAQETGRDPELGRFLQLARGYSNISAQGA